MQSEAYQKGKVEQDDEVICSMGSTSTTGGSCDEMINRFLDMNTYFTGNNHGLLASRGYEYDRFFVFLNILF